MNRVDETGQARIARLRSSLTQTEHIRLTRVRFECRTRDRDGPLLEDESVVRSFGTGRAPYDALEADDLKRVIALEVNNERIR